MSHITLELEDKTARRLSALACEQGMTVAEYLKKVIDTKPATKPVSVPKKRSTKQKLEAFDTWVASFPKRPGIQLDDSRESIYEGRGE